MKKLLVAAIGAVAACGASAGLISTQRFESVTGELPLQKTISELNTLAGGTFWSGDEITNTYTAVAVSGGLPQDMPLTTPPNKALEVKTKFGNPLSLNAIGGGTATNIPASGIYFDSLVKFTVCDDVPEQAYDGAKIIMWLQESEVNNQTTTNIMVRAGYVNSDYTCATNDYVCKPFTGNIEQYHRVTIKTWASIFDGNDVPGFAIFLDGVKVNLASGYAMASEVVSSLKEATQRVGADAVFPSIVQGNAAGKSTISSVAFDGTGYITDLVFTDEAPFTAAEDYVAPKATVNGTDYTTLEAAVAAVNAISSGDVTFALAKNMTLSGTLAFTSAANVIFDFAGFVLTNNGTTPAISNNGYLVITNSTGNGGIVCTSTGAAVVSGDSAGQTDIMAGFFDGLIVEDGLDILQVYGGSFRDKTAALAPGRAYTTNPDPETGLYGIVIDPWFEYLGAQDASGAYTIDDETDLIAFKDGVAAGLETDGVTFKLTGDIALTAAWPGIGIQNGKDLVTSATQSDVDAFDAGAFQGTFDGQNHTISGFQIIGKGGNTVGLDYAGFFNSTYGATIQNLKIQYAGSLFAADTTAETKESGATFVGVAKDSTLRNLTTVAGTVSCSKGFGGIVGYLYGTTVDSCTNNVNMTSLANNKCGGIAMICQKAGCSISNCENNGTMTTGSGEHGGIVGYTDTITISNCKNTAACKMFYHHGGDVTLQGVNTGNATVQSYTGNATPGLNFATVDGSVATFVADNALVLNGSYKVMATGATATFAFAEAGTIAFDTALFTPTYAITAGSGLELTDATVGTVKTYTAASSSPWPQPSEDTPAAVNAALAEDGFSTGTGVVTNKVQYDALIAYVTATTSATKPTDLTAAQKANAVLCYALNAASIPATEIAQEDITIDALATGDNGAVDLTVAIDGVTVGQSVPAATLAKIVTAKGGTTLNAMSTENVTVSGHAVDTGKVTITVTPNANSPTSFFTTVIINK